MLFIKYFENIIFVYFKKMGISLDKMRHLSKKDSTIDKKESKDIEKKIESGEIIGKRNNSITHSKENKNLIKNIETQIDNIQNNKYKKGHKCLFFEKYQKIEEPIKNINLNTLNKDISKENGPKLNSKKKIKQLYQKLKKKIGIIIILIILLNHKAQKNVQIITLILLVTKMF